MIDDLGQEYDDMRNYSCQRLDELMAKRHGAMLPTVVTSNLDLKEIGQEFGARVHSERWRQG